MNDVLLGLAVSNGYGIGKAMVIKEISLDYTPAKITDVKKERERFYSALNSFCYNTKKLSEKVRSTTGIKEADILLGHIAMAKDTYMLSEVEKKIASGICAEAAVEKVCDMFIGMFSCADDELTQQRSADVQDIKRGLLSALLKRNERDISLAPPNTILVVSELTPQMTAGMVIKNIVGIIAETGRATSHSAIIARAMEIPTVLSVPCATEIIKDGANIILDGNKGIVITHPETEEIDKYTKKRAQFIEEQKELYKFAGIPTITADGTPIELLCNISKPEDAIKALKYDGEGVGLFRTEFLFMNRSSPPGEDEQFEAYKKVALIMKEKPVTIRTLDIGGDKNIPYLNINKEENPFLGFRAIRYCLKNTGLYLEQLRAILRASIYGNIRIMIPFISSADEILSVKQLITTAKKQLHEQSIAYDDSIKLGVMIETPSAVMLADKLAGCSDFFSIGTNDLTQYIMASDRGNAAVSYLYSPYHPAVLRSIHHVISCAASAGIAVGICGEAATEEKLIPLFLSWGLNEFSVTPSSVLSVRRQIFCAKVNEYTSKKILLADSEEDVRFALGV